MVLVLPASKNQMVLPSVQLGKYLRGRVHCWTKLDCRLHFGRMLRSTFATQLILKNVMVIRLGIVATRRARSLGQRYRLDVMLNSSLVRLERISAATSSRHVLCLVYFWDTLFNLEVSGKMSLWSCQLRSFNLLME